MTPAQLFACMNCGGVIMPQIGGRQDPTLPRRCRVCGYTGPMAELSADHVYVRSMPDGTSQTRAREENARRAQEIHRTDDYPAR